MERSTNKQTKTMTVMTEATDHVGVPSNDLPTLNVSSIVFTALISSSPHRDGEKDSIFLCGKIKIQEIRDWVGHCSL